MALPGGDGGVMVLPGPSAFRDRRGSFAIEAVIEDRFTAALAEFLGDLAPQAMMAAADDVSEWGKEALRAPIRTALGTRVANTVRSRVWPARGQAASLTPAVSWWTNAPHIVNAFAEVFTITAHRAKWLVIPTENAPARARVVGYSGRIQRGRSALLRAVEARFGKLRFVPIRPDLALLVVDGVRRRRGKRGGFSPASEAARRRKDFENGVAMFILVPAARSPRRYDLNLVRDRIESHGPDRFAEAFSAVAAARFPER